MGLRCLTIERKSLHKSAKKNICNSQLTEAVWAIKICKTKITTTQHRKVNLFR